jgi:hypothetical protein
MQRALTASFCVALATTVSANAASPSLNGSYAFTGTLACLTAPGSVPGTTPLPNPTPGVALPNSGFNASLQPIVPETAFSHSNSILGIRTFNGDGTGTVSASEVSIVPRPTPGPTGFPHFPPSADSATINYSFTYSFNADGSFTTSLVPNSFKGTFTSGPRFNPNPPPASQTFSVTLPDLIGIPSSNSATIVLSTLVPAVEVVTFSNGDVWPRICHRSRVLIFMGGK